MTNEERIAKWRKEKLSQATQHEKTARKQVQDAVPIYGEGAGYSEADSAIPYTREDATLSAAQAALMGSTSHAATSHNPSAPPSSPHTPQDPVRRDAIRHDPIITKPHDTQQMRGTKAYDSSDSTSPPQPTAKAYSSARPSQGENASISPEASRKKEAISSMLPDERSIASLQVASTQRRQRNARSQRIKLWLFVGLPILLIVFYMAFIATPLYEATATFAVVTSENDASTPPTMAAGMGLGGASSVHDEYRLREYLLSPQAMRLMEENYGFLTHFHEAELDPLSKPLDMAAFGYDDFSYYKKRIHIVVDVQEGLAYLKVQAATSEDALRFAKALLELGSDKARADSDALNSDQITTLKTIVEEAQEEVQTISAEVIAIQRDQGELNPENTQATIYEVISNFELQLAEAQNQRNELLSKGLDRSPLLSGLRSRISALKRQIASQRAKLTEGVRTAEQQENYVAFERLSADRDMAYKRLESAMNTLEQMQVKALTGRKYLLVVAEPVETTIPRGQRLPYMLALSALAGVLLWVLGGIVTNVRNTKL